MFFFRLKSALKRIFGGYLAYAVVIITEAVSVTEQNFKMRNLWTQQDKQKAPLPGTNPQDRYRCRSKCAVSQSTFHWAKDCTNRREQVKLTNVDESEDSGRMQYHSIYKRGRNSHDSVLVQL